MERRRNGLIIFLFTLLVVTTSSCMDDVVTKENQIKNEFNIASMKESDSSTLSIEEVKEIASNFFRKADVKNGLRSSTKEISISMMYTVKALDSINLYAFNRENGGFVLINPIKRSSSRIIAYSDVDNFSEEMLNSTPFLIWKDYIMDCILNQDIALSGNDVKSRANSLTLRAYPRWVEDILKTKVGDLTPEKEKELVDYLRKEILITYPLIKTSFHQGSPYNDDCPNGCPAGCVAISVGQVVNYYRKWDGGNWNFNKINSSTTPDISKYIYAIGRGLKMIYKHDGSYPDWGNLNFITDLNYREVSFLKDIGYWAKSYTVSSNSSRLIEELSSIKHPVIMNGYKKQFVVPYDGHSWIADGIKTRKSTYIMNKQQARDIGFIFSDQLKYEDLPVRYLLYEETNYFLHFNMGWADSNNTWYLYIGDVAEHNFKYKHHIKFIIIKK